MLIAILALAAFSFASFALTSWQGEVFSRNQIQMLRLGVDLLVRFPYACVSRRQQTC